MSNGATVTFNDPRRFGSMKLVPRAKLDQEPLLRAIGPEPLGNEFDAAMLAQACAGKKTSLKAALIDQRVVAGLGNIYVCEALYRARLSPKRQASTIADRTANRMNAPGRWSMPSRRCSTTRSRPAARRCAITAAPTARSAISSTIFRSTTARASRVPDCKGKVKRIVQTGARPSIVRRARNSPRWPSERRGMDMRKLGLIAFMLAAASTLAGAAEFPDHPIRFIVPQAAGSATDTVARVLAAELTKEFGQQVIVDDRPGGALTIGLDLVAKSAPDGYTIGMGPIGALAEFLGQFRRENACNGIGRASRCLWNDKPDGVVGKFSGPREGRRGSKHECNEAKLSHVDTPASDGQRGLFLA